MASQVASKRNRQISTEHTRATGRNKRINAEYMSGSQTISGDFKNKAEQRGWRTKENKGGLTQQNIGNHKQRYADLVAAFGRASKKGGKGGLSFSAG